MRQDIETAPRDRKVIIIEDKLTGTSDFAHWSPQLGQWVREDGGLSQVSPTHWYPIPDELRFARDEKGNILDEEDRAALELLLRNNAAEAEYPGSNLLRGSIVFTIAV